MLTLEKLNNTKRRLVMYALPLCLLCFFLGLTWIQLGNLHHVVAMDLSTSTEEALALTRSDYFKLSLEGDRAPETEKDYRSLPHVDGQASYTVPREALFLRKDLHFPLRYTITGSGDSSWEQLSLRFYGNSHSGERLKYENPALANQELRAGVTVTIPAPSAVPQLQNQQEATNIPHVGDGVAIQGDGSIQATPEEIDLFARILAAESGPGWDYRGVRMIAETITNRVRNYHMSLYSVIFQKGQFSVIDNGSYLTVAVNELHRQIAVESLQGNLYLPANVEFFCTTTAYAEQSWFQSLKVFTQYDNTVFMGK